MKKVILIITFSLFTFFVKAQDTKKDSAKVDTLLHLPAVNKETAKAVLKAMSIAEMIIPDSDQITAKDATESQKIYKAFITLILKRYPDLIPPASNN